MPARRRASRDGPPDPAEPGHIAFYGSLMRGLGPLESLGVAPMLRPAGACVLAGRLLDLGRYPGLVTGTARVRAELFEIRSPSVLEVLDRYEGFDPDRPRDSLFLRERVRLLAPGGTAWVYTYNRPAGGHPVVASGDWRSHLATRGH